MPVPFGQVLPGDRPDRDAVVVGQGVWLAFAGVAAGVVVALLLSRILESLLFEVTPADPAVFGSIVVLLAAVATVACLVPARRAVRVDPVVALRDE